MARNIKAQSLKGLPVNDDLVTRLRQAHKDADEVAAVFLAKESADEIERLRDELQSYYDEDEEIRRGRSGE